MRRSAVITAILDATGVDLKQPESGDAIIKAIEYLELLRMGGAPLPAKDS